MPGPNLDPDLELREVGIAFLLKCAQRFQVCRGPHRSSEDAFFTCASRMYHIHAGNDKQFLGRKW